MISARSAEKQVKKGLENYLGGALKEVDVKVQEGEGSLTISAKFSVEEGEIRSGGEVRKVVPGTYEIEAEVTFGKRGNMIEARFFGKCKDAQLSDMYVVEEGKLDNVRSWLADKIGALAVQCSSQAEESADIGGVLGW
ncbi:hypothetical protein EYM_05835 [Ignicoccus islandicus DSM 13165]|uniref:Uncharacterized protein n=1 Tax=Ignicoccus islandicus DSM 13165 TaxID=940295 RepID=A0A0U2VF67_9CREN|nr:hypothetical protein [Ignicoccus islandicus]ALU12626.1 hypothetical protein EYM_05835 [Ignicoccus islandicus DSM 13165]